MIPTREEWTEALKKRYGRKLQKEVSAAAVVICGLGGLGSNIAVLLARAGVGTLILIDFDRVDLTNIHRQQYKVQQIGKYKTEALKENLLEISPYTNVITHRVQITKNNIDEFLGEAEVICEAFDDANTKAMLTNHVLEKYPQKYLVAASGMAGMGTANSIHTRKITKHFYLCGDETSDAAEDIGLIASRVAVCGAHQAHIILKILANQLDT